MAQTEHRLVATGSLSAGGDRRGPRGWRRGKERVKRRAAGAGADPPPRAFHEVDARRGPAETDPGPRALTLPLTPLRNFPQFYRRTEKTSTARIDVFNVNGAPLSPRVRYPMSIFRMRRPPLKVRRHGAPTCRPPKRVSF